MKVWHRAYVFYSAGYVGLGSLAHEVSINNQSDGQKDYFAYRMAIAQLSLTSFTETPLFFSVGENDVEKRFWIDVIEYFRKLSLTRQIIVITTDPKMGNKLIGDGWPCLR